MQERLDQIGLLFERVAAVDGEMLDFSLAEFKGRSFRFTHGRHRNPAEIGCYLSHVECARRLLVSECEFALVRSAALRMSII